MIKTKQHKWIAMVSALTLALLIGGVSLLINTSTASAAEMTIDDLKTITQASTGPGLLGDGYLAHGGGGRWGLKGSSIDYKQLLATALGISVEKLEAAYETARTAAIEQAVTEGLITREQADKMLAQDSLGHKGWFSLGFRRGHKGIANDTIDENALLAGALGISVDELQAARETAKRAAIAQAVAQGIITQEQADNMQNGRGTQPDMPMKPDRRDKFPGRGESGDKRPACPGTDEDNKSGTHFRRSGRVVQGENDL